MLSVVAGVDEGVCGQLWTATKEEGCRVGGRGGEGREGWRDGGREEGKVGAKMVACDIIMCDIRLHFISQSQKIIPCIITIITTHAYILCLLTCKLLSE